MGFLPCFILGILPICVMAASSLEDVMSACGVDPGISTDLVAGGWTAENFACVAPTEEALDSIWGELVPHDELTLLQKSALRAAFKRCRQALEPAASSGPNTTAPIPLEGMPPSSWSESFAPKLDQAKISQLKEKFTACYPSELVNHDTMPSTRLLSLVYHQLQKKQWTWVPWKYRLTMTKAEELSHQRPTKIPKVEMASLHNLLVDEPPSIDINNANMGINSVRNLLAVHDMAIAMCGGAHLANLKAYSHKFLSFLTQRIDPDSMLRCASITESQSADRQIWGTISDLMSERGWNLDDSLHEMTHIRHDLPGLLQLRPRAPKAVTWSGPTSTPSSPSKGKGGKSSGKSKGKTKGKGKVQWLTDIKTKDGQWRQLCMRFQTGKCSLSADQCKFHHACAYPVNGSACGLDHGALQHQQTTH